MESPTLTKLMQAVHSLDTRELDRFANHVLTLRADRHTDHLDAEETHLLLRINEPLPVDLQETYTTLCAKRTAETLTPTEHQKLLQLTERVEAFDAQRIAYLAQLAQLRQTTLPHVMDQLGITLLPHA